MQKEIFKDIVGYEGLYQISNLGNIKKINYRNIGLDKAIKTSKNRYGYLVVNLTKDKKSKLCTIHRLVALTFLDNPENKEQVNHINGIKSDNRVENLEWNTRSENQIHAFKLGLIGRTKGEKHHLCKLNNEIVLSIRNDLRPNSHIAKQYNISHTLVYKIKNNKTWNHI